MDGVESNGTARSLRRTLGKDTKAEDRHRSPGTANGPVSGRTDRRAGRRPKPSGGFFGLRDLGCELRGSLGDPEGTQKM